jgi:hypothetical protein
MRSLFSQSQTPTAPRSAVGFYAVWLPLGLPRLADHPVYLGSASFISLSLSTVDESNLNRAFIKVNANYRCNALTESCEYPATQDAVGLGLINSAFHFSRVFHTTLHKSQPPRNPQLYPTFVLTRKLSRRILLIVEKNI